MNALYSTLFTIYFAIVIISFGKIAYIYHVRQLVKANFWCNLAIFALLSFLTLIILIEFYAEQ